MQPDDDRDDRERSLFLDAVVSYADACTRPLLTPSCPYYVESEIGPRCGEECRAIIESHGVGSRPVRQGAVDGLVLTGRAIPRDVVSGWNDFDAAELYIQQRDDQPQFQSTASLLLSLRTVVTQRLLGTPVSIYNDPMELWGSLVQRGLDMDRVAIGGLARAIANAIALRTILNKFADGGLLPADSQLRVGSTFEPAPSWTEILDAMYLAQTARGTLSSRNRSSDDPIAVLNEVFPGLGEDQDLVNFATSHPEVSFALSRSFLDRISEWVTHQIADDLEGALSGTPPNLALFSAFPAHGLRDEVGLWLWERFTITAVDTWSLSSLLLEWKWARDGQIDACSHQVMAERVVAPEVVGELALSRASEARGKIKVHAGLDAAMFTRHATEMLLGGQWTAATKVFRGLVDLRPGDGEAWNNLGFCQLIGDAGAALDSLRRASLLQRRPKMICLANQALALHLLGQDVEAIAMASYALDQGSDGAELAYVWAHPTDLGDLELADGEPRAYVQGLMGHLRDGSCSYSQNAT